MTVGGWSAGSVRGRGRPGESPGPGLARRSRLRASAWPAGAWANASGSSPPARSCSASRPTRCSSACEVALVDLAGDDDLVAVLAPGTSRPRSATSSGRSFWPLTAALGWGSRAPFLVGAVVLLVLRRGAGRSSRCPRPDGDPEPTTARADVWACLRDRRVWQLGLISLLSTPWTSRSSASPSPTSRSTAASPHGVAVLVGGSVVVGGIVGAAALAACVRYSSSDRGRDVRPSALAALALAASVLGIMVAPAHPAAGPVRADHRHGQRHLLDPAAGPDPRTPPGPARHDGRGRRLPGLPGALVPLVAAAAAADHFGTGRRSRVASGRPRCVIVVDRASPGRSDPAAHLAGASRPLSARPRSTGSSVRPPSTMR